MLLHAGVHHQHQSYPYSVLSSNDPDPFPSCYIKSVLPLQLCSHSSLSISLSLSLALSFSSMRSSFHCSCVPLRFHQLPPQYHSGVLDHVIVSSILHFVRVRGPVPVRMRTWKQANAVETIKSTFMLLWCWSMLLAQRLLLKKVDEGWLSISVASIRVIVGRWISHLTCWDFAGIWRKRVAKCPKSSRVLAVEFCKKLEIIFA
jgi:hypothetical protein